MTEEKKRGRKAMTEEQKKAAATARAERKKQAENMKPAIVLQYQGTDANVNELIEKAKSEFKEVKKRTPITSLNIYLKPEESTAYYVINETFEGAIQY